MEAAGIRIIRYSKQDAVFSIWDLADLHMGNRGMSWDHLLRDIERIKNDPYALVFIGGDYLDAIHWTDSRFDPECFPEDFTVNDLSGFAYYLTEKLIDTISTIKQKIIGICFGNHEFVLFNKKSMMFIHDNLCKRLNAVNMKYSGIMDLYFVHDPDVHGCRNYQSDIIPVNYTFKLRICIHHGFSAAATPGGKINALMRLANILADSHLVMMSHLHESFIKPVIRMSVNEDCSQTKQKGCLAILNGSYLRIYGHGTSYGEQRGYSPTTLGAVPAKFSPMYKRLSAETGIDI